MDESNKLLSEILKTSVHLNDESTVKKGKQTFNLFLLGLLYLAVYSFVVSDDEKFCWCFFSYNVKYQKLE